MQKERVPPAPPMPPPRQSKRTLSCRHIRKLPRLDLGVDWGSPWREFRTSWHDFFRGPRVPQDSELPADSDLRVEWIEGNFPGRAFTASALWHVAAGGIAAASHLAFSGERPAESRAGAH